jgi:hypothetical protein
MNRRTVVNDRDIDEVLRKTAEAPHVVEPALLQRIAGSLEPSLRPVRPLPRTWVLSLGLVLIAGVVALAGALRAGFYGLEKMDLLERVVIFSTLIVVACAAGAEFVNTMIPGSRRRISAGSLLATAILILLAVFGLLFRDYHTAHFFSAGILCLVTGVAHAIPVGLLSWLLLRRGFAVNPVVAGLVGGTFAGIAGISLLELHCVNFQAFHILVWHTAVVPVCAALGALLARFLHRRA